MERFKKWRDSLTWKQTVIMEQIMVISIYIIIRLIFFAIGVKFSSFKDAITYELLLFVLVYAVMYALISKVYGTSSKLEKESQKKAYKKARENFQFDENEYTEIVRRPDGYHRQSVSAEMDFITVQKLGCRYFIKIISEEEYNLVEKDQNGEVIYDKVLSDWKYLNNIFKW